MVASRSLGWGWSLRRRSRRGSLFHNGRATDVAQKEFLEHRDPHLLGPPLRPDPQSYSALSDYLLTYSYSPTLSFGIFSAIVLVLVLSSGWLFAPPFYYAMSFFDFRAHLGQFVCCIVSSVSRV